MNSATIDVPSANTPKLYRIKPIRRYPPRKGDDFAMTVKRHKYYLGEGAIINVLKND